MRKLAIILSILVLSGATSIAVEAYRRGTSEPAAAQDPVYLDRRISLLEQRFNMLESTISRLQQQAAAPAITPAQPTRNPEIDLVRSELEILKSYLREVRCGVVHLDERTLSPAAKEARKRSGSEPPDPCRQFPDSPVQLTPIR